MSLLKKKQKIQLQQKYKDITIEIRKNMPYKLKELCKVKCKNTKVDFSKKNLGYYSCRIITKNSKKR